MKSACRHARSPTPSEIGDFLTSKYTNEQLYDWMLTQLTTVHTQAYQLAFALAQQAEAA